MVVVVMDKRSGKISRYPLMGNMSIGAEYITLNKDPRATLCSKVMLPVSQYEVVRVTDDELETPEAIRSRVSTSPRREAYIYNVFG